MTVYLLVLMMLEIPVQMAACPGYQEWVQLVTRKDLK